MDNGKDDQKGCDERRPVTMMEGSVMDKNDTKELRGEGTYILYLTLNWLHYLC